MSAIGTERPVCKTSQICYKRQAYIFHQSLYNTQNPAPNNQFKNQIDKKTFHINIIATLFAPPPPITRTSDYSRSVHLLNRDWGLPSALTARPSGSQRSVSFVSFPQS